MYRIKHQCTICTEVNTGVLICTEVLKQRCTICTEVNTGAQFVQEIIIIYAYSTFPRYHTYDDVTGWFCMPGCC